MAPVNHTPGIFAKLFGSPTTQVKQCKFCGVRPRYYDSRIPKLHPFCGKICASESAKPALCKHCKRYPKSGSYPFCGKKCAAAAAERKKLETCSHKGCTKLATVYPIGTHHWNYCSVRHEELAVWGCINCRAVLYTGDIPLCTLCNSYLAVDAPFILPVPQDHSTYLAVREQFTTSWAHPIKEKRPVVRMVYRIIPARNVWGSYWAYRDALEAKGKFSEKGERPGNEHSLWHGTFRACRIGEPGQNTLCISPDCSLCSITRGTFNLTLAKRTAFQRFGRGIYTSSKSSKSDSYSRNKLRSPLKAALLNSVVAGSVYIVSHNAPHLTKPPEGYDSVRGIPGKNLNYDELVVYTDDAIRPTHIVIYEFISK